MNDAQGKRRYSNPVSMWEKFLDGLAAASGVIRA